MFHRIIGKGFKINEFIFYEKKFEDSYISTQMNHGKDARGAGTDTTMLAVRQFFRELIWVW